MEDGKTNDLAWAEELFEYYLSYIIMFWEFLSTTRDIKEKRQ